MVDGPTDKSRISVAKAQLFHRFLDVTGDAIVELALVDTGNVASDGTPIYAMGTVAVPTGTSDGPDGETSAAFACTGGTDALPATTDARYVWIQNDPGNANDILIFGIMNLGPGEQMIIPTGVDASWITFVGTAADTLNYAILRRT